MAGRNLFAEQPAVLPSTGRPMLQNPDGSVSTEESMTVTSPRLNNGAPTNIPSIWGGKRPPFDPGTLEAEEWAIDQAANSGQTFETFPSIEDAVKAARARSNSLGVEVDATQKGRNLLSDPEMTASRGAEVRSGPPIDMDWKDVGSGVLRNLPKSTVQLVKDMVHPVLHPIDTAKTVGELVVGGVQKLIPGEQSSEPTADAVWDFIVERYGSPEAAKRALSTDPAGVLSDATMVLTGGGAIAARAPGMAAKLGKVAGAAGDVIDPIAMAGKGINAVVTKAVPDVIGGLGTHTGGDSLRIAAGAGFEGGRRAQRFQDNLRGKVPIETVVEDARRSLDQVRRDRGQKYVQDMAQINADTTVLSFQPIDQAIAKVADVGTFKGVSGTQPGVDIKPGAAEVWGKIDQAIAEWRALDPAEFHTVQGIDALKQKIGNIRDGTQFGSPERKVAGDVYRAVREQIVQQAPDYAKAMKAYEETSDLIEEVSRALSLGEKAAVDTTLRKLQSVLRDNVNTNYGNRRELLGELPGSEALLDSLAGQALSSTTPRGLGKVVAGGTGISALSLADPLMAAMLIPQSPRLMGEAAYYSGKAAKAVSRPFAAVPPLPVARASVQAGRLDDRTRREMATILLNAR